MHQRVVFLHPDLGIGGAERLIVDVALALNSSKYLIKIITNHHDRTHCFEETLKPELNVTVVADWFPRSFLGRFCALCAYIRMLLATLYLVLTCNSRDDLVFVDQVSAPLPLLRLFGYETVFYCHFPDLLLSDHKSFFKKMYRKPLDWFEEYSIGWASKVLVNSQFTRSVFHRTFTSLRHLSPEVLYPVPNLESLSLPSNVQETRNDGVTVDREGCRGLLPAGTIPSSASFVILSINRYERKKNIQLSLFALSHLINHWNELIELPSDTVLDSSFVHLVVAGGYDDRVQENVDYHKELVDIARKLAIESQVTFVRSCPSAVKAFLIASCNVLCYTPEGEHFGIVPVEAMLMSRPVVALDSGGPRETVLHGSTGLLCPTHPAARLPATMAAQFARFINDPQLTIRFGKAGCRRAKEKFSFAAFREQLCDIVGRN